MIFLTVFEQAQDATWTAYVPELSGCEAVGQSINECRASIIEAIGKRVAALRDSGQLIPPSSNTVETVRFDEQGNVFPQRGDEEGFEKVNVECVVVFEKSEGTNWGAYSPDVPGCISTGETLEEVRRNYCEALNLHLEGMREEGLPTPEAKAIVESIRID